MKKAVLMICVIAVLCGCTRPDAARQALENAGYSDVEITGWRPLMAGHGDSFSTGFRAKAVNGRTVTGAVTAGWLKGSTIRTD